ncbi:MAG TPA: KOW domain-containing RNA-binding protein [Limnochordales bacterium]
MTEQGAAGPPRVRAGQLVTSRAGRDAGRAYLVVGVRPDGRVLVADGRYRKVANAKPKNVRHLWLHDRVAAAVAERLERGEPVSDAEVRRALQELLGEAAAAGEKG